MRLAPHSISRLVAKATRRIKPSDIHAAGAHPLRCERGATAALEPVFEEYLVAAVREVGGNGELAPPEIMERFEGRAFRLVDLEHRGVRIAGGRAYYTANGRDWLLELQPPMGRA